MVFVETYQMSTNLGKWENFFPLDKLTVADAQMRIGLITNKTKET